jgi:hypothetical protein
MINNNFLIIFFFPLLSIYTAVFLIEAPIIFFLTNCPVFLCSWYSIIIKVARLISSALPFINFKEEFGKVSGISLLQTRMKQLWQEPF